MKGDSQNYHRRQQSRSSKTLVLNNVVDRWSSPDFPRTRSRTSQLPARLRIRAPCSTDETMLFESPWSSSGNSRTFAHARADKNGAAHFCTKNDQSGSTALTAFRICSFLPSPCHLQSFPVRVGTPSSSSAVPVERRHHCQLRTGHLHAVEAVSNDFQLPPVQPVGVQQTRSNENEHVFRKPLPPTPTPLRPSTPAVAQGVEWTRGVNP